MFVEGLYWKENLLLEFGSFGNTKRLSVHNMLYTFQVPRPIAKT